MPARITTGVSGPSSLHEASCSCIDIWEAALLKIKQSCYRTENPTKVKPPSKGLNMGMGNGICSGVVSAPFLLPDISATLGNRLTL